MSAEERLPAPDAETGDAAVRDLIARAQAGDQDARAELVESNLRLVRSIVARFGTREHEDLFQLGCIGLLKAVDRFDLSYPVRFSTYAVPMILGEVRRHLRDDGPMRVSRTLKSLAQSAHRTQEALAKELGRDPSVAEVAAALQAPVDAVVAALDSSRPLASIQEPIYAGDGDPIHLGDQLHDGSTGEPLWLNRVALRDGMALLEERERTILLLRYFRDRTQVEVARLLGISQVQVSRLERRALAQIRTYLLGPEG